MHQVKMNFVNFVFFVVFILGGVRLGLPAAGQELSGLQREIDASTAGNGMVVVRGVRESGQINLRSNTTLVFEEGARLVGSTNSADYGERAMPATSIGAGRTMSALVFASGVTNVTIRGRGVIDGRGQSFPRVNDSANRPRLVYFHRCRDVVVEDVTLTNSPRWTCFFQECENVSVRNVKVDAHANFNNDGLDIEAKNVLVENCTIDSDDDGICLKSHNPGFVVENVRVRNCRVASNCNFLKLGTRGHGGFRNVEISDCVLHPCRVDGIRNWHKWQPKLAGVTDPVTGLAGIALEQVDGGILENVHVHGIDMTAGGVQTPIFVRLAKRTVRAGRDGAPSPSVVGGGAPTLPRGNGTRLENVVIEDVKGVSVSAIASSITGVPGLRPANVTIRNIDLAVKGGGRRMDALCPVPEAADSYPENRCFDQHMLPAYGFYVRHTDGVRFENVRLRLLDNAHDEREPVVCEDSTDVTFTNCAFAPATKPRPGPEKYVYVEGETVVLQLEAPGAYTLCSWRLMGGQAAEPERQQSCRPPGEACRAEPERQQSCRPPNVLQSRGTTPLVSFASSRGVLQEGCSDGAGRVVLQGLPKGYYTVKCGTNLYDFAVVIDPAKRRDDPDGFIGVDSALSWVSKPEFFSVPLYGGDTFRYVADLMRLAGIRRARERLGWGDVQPRRGQAPDFGHYGINQRRLAERGIAVCGMFQSVPKWMPKIDRLPADFAELFRFTKTLAQEMPGMEAWEFWNEEIEGFAPEAAWDFAAVNKVAALGFHAGRADLKVLNGSLCFAPNDYDRLLFANGLGRYLDAINIHAYPALSDYPEVFGGRRAFAAEVGEGDQAIWTTECGTMSMGVPELPGRNRKERRFSRDQELLLAEFFPKSQCYQMMEGIARNYFFVFGAYCENGGKKDFSVLRRDGSVGPVYSAIATTTEKLAGMKLEGELDVGAGIRTFLFTGRAGSERQTVAFASVSDFDAAHLARKPVSKVGDECLRGFTLPAADGDYVLTDLCGTPSTVTAKDGSLKLSSSRFMQYVEGLGGLTARKPAQKVNPSKRCVPRTDEDLSIVIRPVFRKDDHVLGGIKSVARLLKRSVPVAFEIWNLSDKPKRGRLEVVRGGAVKGLPEDVSLSPMAKTRIEGVYTPDHEGSGRVGAPSPTACGHCVLEVRGVFDSRVTTPTVVPIESLGDFFQTCRKVVLDGANPERWKRNDSADEYACVRDGDAVKMSVKWTKDADRWFYPKYVFAANETAAGAEFLEFEAKSVMTGGRNRYVCQNYWLDAATGGGDRHDLAPTGTDWRRYRIPLKGTINPHTGKPGLDPATLRGFRLGGNPAESELTFWVRNLKVLVR